MLLYCSECWYPQAAKSIQRWQPSFVKFDFSFVLSDCVETWSVRKTYLYIKLINDLDFIAFFFYKLHVFSVYIKPIAINESVADRW